MGHILIFGVKLKKYVLYVELSYNHIFTFLLPNVRVYRHYCYCSPVSFDKFVTRFQLVKDTRSSLHSFRTYLHVTISKEYHCRKYAHIACKETNGRLYPNLTDQGLPSYQWNYPELSVKFVNAT